MENKGMLIERERVRERERERERCPRLRCAHTTEKKKTLPLTNK